MQVTCYLELWWQWFSEASMSRDGAPLSRVSNGNIPHVPSVQSAARTAGVHNMQQECHVFAFLLVFMKTYFWLLSDLLMYVDTDWCDPAQSFSTLLPPLSRRRTSEFVWLNSQGVINVVPLDSHMTTVAVTFNSMLNIQECVCVFVQK